MTDDSQKGRSPNSPKFDLGQAIELVRALHNKIGRSAVKAEIAAGALGYKGMNGAALGTLGAISQYGLIGRSSGNVQVTDLALRILHPLDEAKKNAALKEAALNPKVFGEIYENWNDMTEDVLANHLIHKRFIPEAAKRAASVYKLNYDIAKLGAPSNDGAQNATPQAPSKPTEVDNSRAAQTPPASSKPQEPARNMLATFKIPVGSAEAEIIFTGEKLEAADFDAVSEYMELFKKQYGRKLGLAGDQLAAFVKNGTLQAHSKLADSANEKPATS
jgi:hypothetical protein